LSNFIQIQEKLEQFIKKYYLNELIKGLLLFFTLGVIYFIVTLLIEHFFWLKPIARTLLFSLFVLVEIALLIFYICIPIFKIWGLKKGIDKFEASKIIGAHFPEVSDKLLNMYQLQEFNENSELIEASIEQKSKELKLVPFKKAIDFASNKKYIKYALIPVLICLFVVITGNITIFNDSFSRVVHYNTQYEPPAPFSFKILNTSFQVIEGQPLTLEVETFGEILPEDVKIYFSNENYYLDNFGLGKFQFSFPSINENFEFFVEANGIVSKNYSIEIIPTPVIANLKMVLQYPKYTGKENEVIINTGNAIVPQGTIIAWQVETHQTKNVAYFEGLNKIEFTQITEDYFSYSKEIDISTNYAIATSNSHLQNYEKLDFAIEVLKDEYPKIIVKSDIDSISHGPVQFLGQLYDDFAISKLQLLYYDKSDPEEIGVVNIDIEKASFSDFYYVFPEGISIEEGIDYEFYFQVFDNDAVNGSKKTKSRKYSYYNKTKNELKEELLKEQKETLNEISKSVEKAKETNAELDKFKNELQKKAEVNWNDTKKLEDFVKRQNQYQEMFEKQTEQLDKNLKEQPTSEDLNERKEELQKRIEETKKLAEEEKLMDELNKLMEKIDKEDLVKKLKEIAKKNKQKEQSLERLLELTKRFYVEQKATQIAEKLDALGDKEEELSKEKDENNTSEKQEAINKEFNEIKKEIKDLEKQNKDLIRPMKLSNDPEKLEEIDEDLQNAMDNLNKQEQNSAKKNQKSASKKMKQLGKSMEQSMMEMEGEMIDENIEDLRKIVENLIEFSFQQEVLMENFSETDNDHPTFPKNLKQQHILKEYFEHIDDSIYVLSLRLIKMGTSIQKEVSEVHFNIDESLVNLSDNRFDQGISNQHFVITSANNLANQLSDLLESLMNASAGMGKGKGNQPEFSLPDVIKKQGEISDKIKEGMEKGKKPGEDKPGQGEPQGSDGSSERMSEELYEIYKQQELLRQALKEMMGNQKGEGKDGAGEAVKQMEELSKELLENGFSKDVMEKIQQLRHELLKLEEAQKEQGIDKKRKSDTNIQSFEKRNIEKLNLQNEYLNYNEILIRQSLPLRSVYKKKVQEYFKNEN